MSTFVYTPNPPNGRTPQPRKPTPLAAYYPQNQSWWPQGKPLGASTRYPTPQHQGTPMNYQASDRTLGSLSSPTLRQRLQVKPPPGTPDYGQSQYLGAIGDRSTDEQASRGASLRGLMNRPVTPATHPSPPSAVATAGRVTPPAPAGMLGSMPPAVTPRREPIVAGGPTGTRAPSGGQPDLFAASLNRPTAPAPGIAQGLPATNLSGQFNTPYFAARQARNAAGQGSPYIPGGNKMTAAQRQEGYAAMAKPASPLAAAMSRPAPQAPQTQFVSRQAEFPQQPSQNPAPGSAPMPQAAAGRPSGQGLQSLTNATEYARYAAQGGQKPLMTYSGTGAREGGLQPSLMPARNREEGLARTNRLGEGGVPTPAVAEAQFGGAIPKVDANGRPFFGSAPKAPAFAGGAATPELAARNRLKGMLALQQRNVGNIEAYTDGNGRQQTAFVGERKDGIPRPVGNEVAGRMVAGGISPTTLTPEQLAANKQGMLSRMMAKRTQAGQMRTERAQAQAIARQNQPSPLMQQMLQQNPELALRFMEANQRGQAIQGQLGNQQAQLALEGRKVDQEAQIARAGLEFKANDSKAEREAKAKGQADLIAADQAKQKDMIAAQQAQQTGNLQFQGKEGEANRANAKDVAAIGAKAAADRIAAEERIKQGSTDAAITAEILKQHPDMSLEEATAFVENRRQGAGGQPSAGPTGGPVAAAPKISEAMKRSYAGGTLKEADYNAVKKFADNGASADELVAMLRSKGLNDEQVGIAINEVMPPNFAANVALAPTGILNLLRGKRFGTNFRSADDPGGWGNALRGRVISPKLRQPPTE